MRKNETRLKWVCRVRNYIKERCIRRRKSGSDNTYNFSLEKHVNIIFRDSERKLSNMNIPFKYMNKIITETMATMARPKLENTEVVRSRHKEKHIRKFERMQRIVNKLVVDMKELQ